MSQADRPKPYAPHGAVDGIVCDTNLAKKMSFIGRFGNSCGIPFVAKEFFKQHRQYEKFEPYVKDRLTQPWSEFTITTAATDTDTATTTTTATTAGGTSYISKKTKGKFKLTKKGREMKNKTKKTKMTDEE